MKKQLVYSGFITEKQYGENEEALFIGDMEYPIIEELEEEIGGKIVSVRYWLSEKEKSKEELQRGVIETLYGNVDASYGDRSSEYTGYLWTDENLIIGGHDLENEMRYNKNKYIYLEIDIEN